LLRPDELEEHKGFLYKVGCFLYEGGIEDSRMQGKGRICFTAQPVEFEGTFRDNQFDGEGTIMFKNKGIALRGRW
jgi:hypothetical protein